MFIVYKKRLYKNTKFLQKMCDTELQKTIPQPKAYKTGLRPITGYFGRNICKNNAKPILAVLLLTSSLWRENHFLEAK